MKLIRTVFLIGAALSALAADLAPLRPPAVPLITHDPYFSIWSTTDELPQGPTKHWTGAAQEITSLVRIDGKPYRLMGADPARTPEPNRTEAAKQTSLQVLPLRSIYTFDQAGVRITLTFTTPSIPNDLDLLSRPATYITWQAVSTDGRSHNVSVFFDAGANLAIDKPGQPVAWSRLNVAGNTVLRLGSTEQPVLAKKGDDLRIDWGYLYVTVPKQFASTTSIGDHNEAWESFRNSGVLPTSDDLDAYTMRRFRYPSLAAALDLGSVSSTPVNRWLVVAYDDGFSIEYFHRKLRPYWRRGRATAATMIEAAVKDYDALQPRVKSFDEELMADLRKAGGEEYARLTALAYRQAMAAHKLVADIDGTPLFFSKENFSNGCIATVDVTYPSAPMFLLLNTKLLRGMLKPILDYAQLERWPFAFAPHDLGTYPQANGQVYGGGELNEINQMPVEESGNMLILMAAITKTEGNTKFAAPYWPLLTKWADYLKAKGLDPENQLSTDDFAGHLAHNANLSIKAILALRSYAWLAQQLGHQQIATEYTKLSADYAAKWSQLSMDDGHYRLAFDKPGTWSQKYNLVWDKLLDYKLFPNEIAEREYAFYKKMQQPYGLPLDNREQYTKLDWIFWTATLASSQQDFEALIKPTYAFAQTTPDRVPLTDWYWTNNAKHRGFQARSVVGGLYIKMLADPSLWKKWSSR